MELSKITVVTSITGGKDRLLEGHCKGNAKWLAFLDFETESKDWAVKKAYGRFNSSRRNSRIHKILIHEYVDTEYSIWLDANLKLLVSPEEVIERYLKDHDIAVYKHPVRDCIYDEATICAKAGLDDPETIIEQVVKYEKDGFPKHRGQAECMMIVRRNTPKIENLNNCWWAEYCRHSVRDQISFMYALDKTGVRLNLIPEQFKEREDGRLIRDGVIEIVPHLTARAEPNV